MRLPRGAVLAAQEVPGLFAAAGGAGVLQVGGAHPAERVAVAQVVEPVDGTLEGGGVEGLGICGRMESVCQSHTNVCMISWKTH